MIWQWDLWEDKYLFRVFNIFFKKIVTITKPLATQYGCHLLWELMFFIDISFNMEYIILENIVTCFKSTILKTPYIINTNAFNDWFT